MSQEGSGVLISDGRCSVRLTRAGEPHELGYPTVIDLHAGPFRGAISDSLLDYGHFSAQLNALYKSLSGDAKLGSYQGFELDLVGSGKGGVEVCVKAIGRHVPLIQLTFSFDIDQSYLPAIIRQIDTEFPAPYRTMPYGR
jgi:hypothetical protein